MSHTLHSPFQNSLLCAFGRPDFCLKRLYYTIRDSLMRISSKYTSFGGNCNKTSLSNLPALKTPVNRHPIGCHTRYTCHSEILYFGPLEDQIFALKVSITRPEQFDVNIIEIHLIWGNCHKISFSNLPSLKTPVNRHPIGCHTRCTRHSKILYFGLLEDQIFA